MFPLQYLIRRHGRSDSAATLIHAAVIMVGSRRSSGGIGVPLFSSIEYVALDVPHLIVDGGRAFTVYAAAGLGVLQDIKRVICFSTISQIGFHDCGNSVCTSDPARGLVTYYIHMS